MNWRKRTCILITLIVPAILVICLHIHAKEGRVLYSVHNNNEQYKTEKETNVPATEGNNQELTDDLLISLQKNG